MVGKSCDTLKKKYIYIEMKQKEYTRTILSNYTSERERKREREEGTKPSAAKKKKLTILENLPKNKTAQK